MLPDGVSLRHKRTSGAFEYDVLRKQIEAHGVATFDLGPALLAERPGRSYCDLFIEQNSCKGHYSVTGNKVVAKIMAG